MGPVVAWLVSVMLTWQPVGRTPWLELRSETPEQTQQRYVELAEAAVAVAYDPANAPLFKGKKGRGKTAALIITIEWLESGFHNRVTTMRGDDKVRSDGGRSWCAGQILLGRDGVGKRGRGSHIARLIPEGWTGQQLEDDPVKCSTVIYRFAANSFEKCRWPTLGAYTGEGCKGGPLAKNRLKRALSISAPITDAEAMQDTYEYLPSELSRAVDAFAPLAAR